ncbi:hypothetical protein D3C84_1218450 [compost metagenome]
MNKAGLQPPQIVSLSLAIGMHPPALSVEAFCARKHLEHMLREEEKRDQQAVN